MVTVTDHPIGHDTDDRRSIESTPSLSRPRLGRLSVGRMVLHAAGALVVLIAVVAMLHGPTPVISDDGSVLAQAQLLSEGRTGTDLPIPAADPSGEFPPLENSTVVDGRAYPYVKHLALPAAVAATTAVFGDVGGVLFSAVSVWLAALAAASLAWRLDRRLAPSTLWATALLTPLIFDANLVVSTGTASAALGFLVLAVVAFRDRPGWMRIAVLVPLAFMVPAWRTEGIFAIAAVAMLATLEPIVVATRSRSWGRMTVVAASAGIVVGLAGIAGYLVDLTAAGRAMSGTATKIVPSAANYDPIAGRISSVWGSLLRPGHEVATSASMLVAVVAALVFIGAVASRRGGPTRVVIGATIAAAAVALVWLAQPPGLVTGLLPAVPLLFAGLLLLGRADLRRPVVGAALAVCAVTAVGVVATSYSAGGGAEWGGRYFHILVPLLVPASLLGLRTARDRLPGSDRIVATIAVVVVAVVPSMVALRAVHDLHGGSARTVEVVLGQIMEARRDMGSLPGGPAGDGGDIVVVSARPTFGRFAWDHLDGVRLLSASDPERIGDVIDGVADGSEVQRVLVLAQDDEQPTGDSLGEWTVLHRNRVGGWQFTQMERTDAHR